MIKAATYRCAEPCLNLDCVLEGAIRFRIGQSLHKVPRCRGTCFWIFIASCVFEKSNGVLGSGMRGDDVSL